ncbi:MAG: hypothetical protein ACAI38_10255 [Myxococcota bacterium]|nr:hypothetical protein [Myxococcota bacterium]
MGPILAPRTTISGNEGVQQDTGLKEEPKPAVDRFVGTHSPPLVRGEAMRPGPDPPTAEGVAARRGAKRPPGTNSYGEPFYPPPTSVDTATTPTVRGDSRMRALDGPRGAEARRNLEEGRRSVDAHAAPLVKALNDRAAAIEATQPERAARLRQAARDMPEVTLGMLGIESTWNTGSKNIKADGPLQVNGTAQTEAAAGLRHVDPGLASVDRTTVAGGVRAGMAHLTWNLMQDRFDGDLRRAVSQFNGGNSEGNAYARPGSQQNGYVAAAYDLAHRLRSVPRQ